MADEPQLNSVELAAELTIAWLSNQNVRVIAEDVPSFLKAVHGTIQELSGVTGSISADAAPNEQTPQHEPAVSVRRSLASKDHIISLIDGKPYKTLRRHLAGHGLTPEQYRERYNLKPDYPMTSQRYSEARRAMALKIGLGEKGRASRSAPPQVDKGNKAGAARRSSEGAAAKQPRQKSPGRGRRAAAAAADSAPATATPKAKRGRKPTTPAR
jgi:predicted transcriptional regulator